MSGSISSISGNGGSSASVSDAEFQILCDDNGAFLRRFVRDENGAVTVTDTELDGVTGYTATGTVKLCTEETYTESLICANQVTMIRRTSNTGVITFISTDGVTAPAPAVYTIGTCTESQTIKPCATCRS